MHLFIIFIHIKWFLPSPFTLLCNFYLPASKMGLFDALNAEVRKARGGLLLLFSGRGLIARAVAAHWKTELIAGVFSVI